MESGSEAAREDVVSLLAVKDAEIAMLLARVTELEGLVAALGANSVGIPPTVVNRRRRIRLS